MGLIRSWFFYNIKRVLDTYDGTNGYAPFLRGKGHLVVIMISDEKEQSIYYGDDYDAEIFYRELSDYIDPDKVLRFYGAMGLRGMSGCNSGFDYYKGSEFEKIIDLSDGFVISACIDNFGNELAKIGKDILSIVGLPSLLLRRRPVVETLKIYYRGKLLPPGKIEDGGMWFYEEAINTINFYSLSFIKDMKRDYFEIDFDIDDGINRNE